MTLIRKYWIYVVVIVALSVAAVIAFAAQTPRAMYSPPRIKEITIKPVLDMSGAIVAFPVKVTYHVIDAKPSGEVTEVEVGSVEFNLYVKNGTVKVGDELYDYREIMGVIVATADHEWFEVHPPPLLTSRARRSK